LLWISLGLVAANVVVYAAVRRHGFVNFDDPRYVTENAIVAAGLTWRGVVWAFTAGYASNWHPLTWMSHMLDVQLYGMRAGGHHLTNVLLHIANTLLLFGALHRMTGAAGRSGFVAALFAVHPLHVESVAWVAERKDVLSTFFWMLTLWSYVSYVRQPRWNRYVLVVAGGFVLRALAGTLAIDVEISGWLLICTSLLALFLALGKRRHEYLTLDADAAHHRPILAQYSAALLDQMIAVVTASTVTAYALYTMSPETVAKFHTHLLPATLPFVLYGIFRYLYLLYQRHLGGNPSELFLHDRALLLNTLGWIVAVVAIIYGSRVE